MGVANSIDPRKLFHEILRLENITLYDITARNAANSIGMDCRNFDNTIHVLERSNRITAPHFERIERCKQNPVALERS